ncbi:SUMO-conjugating enzyme ubc9-like isoform X2 [Xenia sp. Carnegie-2017]|uniref:SUMO-conjugating enzyme ubc9-like isoform X2 n=1 Tax=Xenia sp. Carnegie-2017 TaxID=2897299 RepID=UPI001F037210|nr:SUMO-conjugating enzyme ubc9-like isoform X2 [Xenia sp. Carnegie-2017]
MASSSPLVDAKERLSEEYKVWKVHHPKGFIAEPQKDEGGILDLLHWKCAIPGMDKTPWAGGSYKLTVNFPNDYPYSPPKCKFCPPIFHPNVFPSGTVSLSLIDKEHGWKPQTTLKEVLVGIQLLLSDPNFDNPAQAEASAVYFNSPSDYENRVVCQAKEMALK